MSCLSIVTFVHHSNNTLVGHPLDHGKDHFYYIKPAITDGGSDTLLRRSSKSCSLFVGQENSDAEIGTPVFFTPFAEKRWCREAFMEAVERKSSSGYGTPPWLHLVKAEKARAFIPKEFKLVEAFGYTLGGFFLASYEDSPVGVFDEQLVVIAGLVWNRPTSCAWATKVYVNSDEACCHGRKEVGLPSQMARFSKTITANSRQQRGRKSGFLNRIGAKFSSPKDPLNVEVTKIKCVDAEETCNINISLTSPVPSLSFGHWVGPTIRMSLPSFSGATEYNPNLLKYSCQIECRVQALKPLKVSESFPSTNDDTEQSLEDHVSSSHVAEDHKNDAQNFSTCVMLSKPILALKFNQMKMQVEAPLVLSPCTNSLQTTVSSVP
ncbi:unnamed protein product [Sphenostylis stenocarpa]|uniref:Uncharacterized protein n=1 Tax=Sphenostylis stenocarpa TaxID=92480 RepID=A0AA86VQZ6_9FABA|nr:unnamed protein product [Sphenostylis stenocarpa]